VLRLLVPQRRARDLAVIPNEPAAPPPSVDPVCVRLFAFIPAPAPVPLTPFLSSLAACAGVGRVCRYGHGR
jgi:hypothetical protein